MMDRVHHGFKEAQLPEPTIRFNFGDGPLSTSISSVDRVLKRHPELERFVTSADPMPGIRGMRRISNGPLSPAAGESIPYETLQAIAHGVPRSFPFHSIMIHFYAPEFGELMPIGARSAEMMAGVLVTDSWWVNGRNRSLSACTIVEADVGGKKLPPQPPAVAGVLAACGKARRTVQVPLAAEISGPVPMVRTPTGMAMPSADPAKTQAVHAIVLDYRTRMSEVVDRAGMPHELPSTADALKEAGLHITAGPKKPALERAFKPLGYSCKGGSGSFTLQRRTAGNLTVQLRMDVGTWGHSVIAMFLVLGVGFKATLTIPVSRTAVAPSQYPIGDADRWQKIVENYAAVVAELDRSFVPDIERVAGPSPEWYRPDS